MQTPAFFQYVAIAVVGGLLFYGAITLWLYLMQDSLLFFPRPLPQSLVKKVQSEIPDAREVHLKMEDGVELHGWMRITPEAKKQAQTSDHSSPRPFVIYFGGNGEEITHILFEEEYANADILALNYRGYGKSQGNPSIKELKTDALQIYDYARQKQDIAPDRIIVSGTSLGSGFAVHVAAHRPVSGAILTVPLDSLLNVGRSKFPLFPVKMALRHELSPLDHAPELGIPALFLIARRDKVIGAAHGERLAASWGGPKDVVLVEEAGHNDIFLYPDYNEAIERFIHTGIPQDSE